MALLLDLLMPPACAACGRAGAILCDGCVGLMVAPNPGDFVAADAGIVIGDVLTLGIGALAFEGSARAALNRLKYAGASRVAVPLAAAAGSAFDRLLQISGPTQLVPVPVHLSRRRERGYNQAALLASRLGAPRGLEVREVLERRSATERQHRLDRAARVRNLRDAISVRSDALIPPVATVIDDILTTSATLEACASVLFEAGSREVYGFAIAREV